MKITNLVNNTVRARGLLAEHGLSFLVEVGDARVLFDTGQGKVLMHNMRELHVRPDTVERVVLSHGHDDHGGGLEAFLREAPHAKVCLHPSSLDRKFKRRVKGASQIGMPPTGERALRARGERLVWTAGPTEIAPGVYVTGEIPRRTSFEDTGGGFYLDEACTKPDPLRDDQALYFESPKGLVLVLGCAHSGVVNTMDYVSQLTKRDTFHAVLGGMHLLRASGERLEKTAEALERRQPALISPAHCTGSKAEAFLRHRFESQFVECVAGAVYSFDA